MSSSRLVLAGFAAALALTSATAASAADPTSADLANMALQQSDMAGAKVGGQRPVVTQGYVGGYARSLTFAKPYGASLILDAESEVDLATTPEAVTADLSKAERTFRSKAGRAAIVATVVKSSGKTVKAKDVHLGKVRVVSIGDRTFALDLSIKIRTTTVYESFVFSRLDRVLASLVLVAAKPVRAAEANALAALVSKHVADGLTPASLGAPAFTGTAGQGQTLTVTPGAWRNSGTVSYSWQRCDAAGANCVAIDGATAPTYVVAAADAGMTLRVVETTTNRFGTASGTSAQSAVVV